MSDLSSLAEFITKLEISDVPDHVKEAGILRVLDTVGTAVGASADEQIQSVMAEWLKKSKGGKNHIWGTDQMTDSSTSVFINAMMGHTQEMDDVHTNSKTHIGTVVIPAAWGMAEYLGTSGQEFLLAVVCGYEVMSRIGMAFGVSAHRNLGWHVTATAGTFGAAAAAGKLLKLNKEKMLYALALAGAQSFGTWAFLGDGANCKALNPARASQAGMEAALLAYAGMTGPEHILTAGDGGLFQCMSHGAELSKVSDQLGSKWQILEVDNKPYPSCRSTHCAIDAVLDICTQHEIKSEKVSHIDVETYLVGYKQCGISESSINPQTIVNAKFSIPFTVACAIVYGEVTLQQLQPEIIQDERIQNLINKVNVWPVEEFTEVYPAHWGCRVRISMESGSSYESYVKDALGSVDRPLNKIQVKEKAVSLMRSVRKEKTEELAEQLLNLERLQTMPVI